MGSLSHNARPSGLSSTDHDRISALAEKGWPVARIAQRIGKHPATVQWFMYRNGLRPPAQTDTASSFTRRDGSVVRRFTREEDAYMQALRVAGSGPSEIAARLTERFGHPRTKHTVQCRLVMLSGMEDA